jgi:hypothetical protein
MPYALPYFLPSVLPGPALDPDVVPSTPTGGDGAGSLATITGGYCADAFALLISQYQDSPRIKALICSLLHTSEETDAAAIDLFWTLFSLEYAQGVGLDLIGKIVRELRDGRGDWEYRNALRVRVLINKSQGRPEDLISIARLFEDHTATAVTFPGRTVHLSEVQPARLEIRIVGTPTNPPQEVNKRLRQAKAGGVALTTIVQAYPSTTGRGFRLSRAADYPELNTTEGLSSAVDGGGGYLLHGMG